jgi:hypothetical protein
MSKILKTSPEGRKCAYPNCTRRLSIYNHEANCHLHLDEVLEKQKPKYTEVNPTAGISALRAPGWDL